MESYLLLQVQHQQKSDFVLQYLIKETFGHTPLNVSVLVDFDKSASKNDNISIFFTNAS